MKNNTNIKVYLFVLTGAAGAALAILFFSSLPMAKKKPAGHSLAENQVLVGGKVVPAKQITPEQREHFKKLKQQQHLKRNVYARSDFQFSSQQEALSCLTQDNSELYQKRMMAFFELAKAWDEDIGLEFYDYLSNKDNRYNLTQREWHSIKSEIMKYVVQKDPSPLRITENFLNIVRDDAHHQILLHYTVQQLDRIAFRIDKSGRTPELNKNLEELFERTLMHSDTALAGTAIMAYHRLNMDGMEIDQQKLQRSVSRVLENPDATHSSLNTALSIAHSKGMHTYVPLAKKSIEENASVSLVITAIDYMGHFGTAADIEWLDRISSSRRENYMKDFVQRAKTLIAMRNKGQQ
ncbi:MAG: hypothetical protein AAGA18_12890 [Verrucomicrobiota bacterium]